LYTRITAKAVRQALIDEKGYTDDELPCENTIRNILNRLGYQLKRIQKTKPLKKIPETDAIFENVDEANRQADEDPDTLRISIDAKAKVNIGEFSERMENPDGLLSPFHSKYNPVERCWGVLEMHWNGTLLSSVNKAIRWAETMTWNSVHPAVHLIDKIYQKGVKLTKEAMKICEERVKRLGNLPKWDVTIEPAFG